MKMYKVEKFDSKFKQLRHRSGLTQRVLADELGVHFSYISKIENGHCDVLPSEDLIYRMAELLDTDGEELLIEIGKFNPKLLEEKTTQDKNTARLIRYIQTGRITPQQIAELMTHYQRIVFKDKPS